MKKSKMFEKSLSYKPFHYPWAIEFATEHGKMHWGEWELQLQEDVNQWKGGEISPAEKEHVKQILRLFTQSDVEVAGNYCDVFIPLFKNNELRQMLMTIAEREAVHQRAYAALNDTLGMDDSEYAAFLGYKEMKDKVEFMQAGRFDFPFEDDPETALKNVGYALAQTICNEGMSLFSAFAMLLNYQRFGKMKGMCEVVEWSIKDEGEHVDVMVKVFRAFCNEHRNILTDEFKKEIYDMYRTAVELEDAVIDLTYVNGAVEGLTKEEVKEYIRYLADRRLIQLGLKPNFQADKNPIPWLEWIVSGTSHKNFFEGRVTDYSQSGMVGDMFAGRVKFTKSMEFTIYTKPNCPQCISAKEILKIKHIPFDEKPLDIDSIQDLQGRFGVDIRTAPQITTNDGGTYVGGYVDLINMIDGVK